MDRQSDGSAVSLGINNPHGVLLCRNCPNLMGPAGLWTQRRRTTGAIEVFGKIKWYSLEKGMGFVEAEDGGKDVFVHITVVKQAHMTALPEGQRILMRVIETAKGAPSGVHSPG